MFINKSWYGYLSNLIVLFLLMVFLHYYFEGTAYYEFVTFTLLLLALLHFLKDPAKYVRTLYYQARFSLLDCSKSIYSLSLSFILALVLTQIYFVLPEVFAIKVELVWFYFLILFVLLVFTDLRWVSKPSTYVPSILEDYIDNYKANKHSMKSPGDDGRLQANVKILTAHFLGKTDNGVESRVTGVEGGWGSGKSLVIAKTCETTATSEAKIINIYISKTTFTNESDLFDYLVSEITNQVRNLTGVDLSQTISKLIEATTLAGNEKSFFLGLFITKPPNLEEYQQEIYNFLEKYAVRLNIVFDDLERVSDSIALTQILNFSKNFALSKNIKIFLVYDRTYLLRVVGRSISMNKDDTSEAEAYLDKFITKYLTLVEPSFDEYIRLFKEILYKKCGEAGVYVVGGSGSRKPKFDVDLFIELVRSAHPNSSTSGWSYREVIKRSNSIVDMLLSGVSVIGPKVHLNTLVGLRYLLFLQDSGAKDNFSEGAYGEVISKIQSHINGAAEDYSQAERNVFSYLNNTGFKYPAYRNFYYTLIGAEDNRITAEVFRDPRLLKSYRNVVEMQSRERGST